MGTVALPRPALALALACVALGGSACGGGDQDDGDAVRAALEALRADFTAGDTEAVCARLSAAARREVGSIGHADPTACWLDVDAFAGALRIGRATPTAAGDVVEVEVEGDRASVLARVGRGARMRLPFVREGGRWRLDAIFGHSAPPPPGLR